MNAYDKEMLYPIVFSFIIIYRIKALRPILMEEIHLFFKDAEILLPDGNTVKAGDIKGGITIADMYGKPQTVRRCKTSPEKEYTYIKFDNGKELMTLTYLSILTWDDEIDAQDLARGDKVLAFIDGEICEVSVTEKYNVTVVNKKNLGMPRKVGMTFLETYEDMPVVANDIIIGLRKQLRFVETHTPNVK